MNALLIDYYSQFDKQGSPNGVASRYFGVIEILHNFRLTRLEQKKNEKKREFKTRRNLKQNEEYGG